MQVTHPSSAEWLNKENLEQIKFFLLKAGELCLCFAHVSMFPLRLMHLQVTSGPKLHSAVNLPIHFPYVGHSVFAPMSSLWVHFTSCWSKSFGSLFSEDLWMEKSLRVCRSKKALISFSLVSDRLATWGILNWRVFFLQHMDGVSLLEPFWFLILLMRGPLLVDVIV